ncbi:MAG: hypothetical protein DBP02_17740 [gamma proteobacterium symbiont of Ctena orbiculata]|nr:MAG: hypothetical protein DBP02_17740 [gamma proteobacterium symbiont of Ctena orbiculata]
MRAFKSNKNISVYAIAGTHVVLLGINASDEARRGLLGFTIEKKGATGDFKPLRGGSRAFENYDVEKFPDSRTAPIQSMMWSDYTVSPDKSYTFKLTPVYGTPEQLQPGGSIQVSVKTERPDDGKHGVFFNRGVAGSQAYSRRFGKHLKYYPTESGYGSRRKLVAKPYIKPEDVPERKAYKWLSRGLEEGMLAFIRQAKGEGWSLRAAVYEFTWMPVLQEFADAIDRGVDVKIVHHAKRKSEYILKYDRTAGVTTVSTWADGSKEEAVFENRYGLKEKRPDDQAQAAINAVRQLGVRNRNRYDVLSDILIARTNTQISHNKFIILLKDDVPQQIWTGSTNFTDGGIFGQSNVGHVVRDPDVAARYMEYWTELSGDPSSTASKKKVTELAPDIVGEAPKGITPIFSPRQKIDMLDWYADRVEAAANSVFFTAAFSVADQILEIVRKRKKTVGDSPYLRYLLLEGRGGLMADKVPIIEKCDQNRLAWGDVLKSRPDLNEKSMLIETLAGLNDHVNFLHTKYMLIDPLSDDPLVISGSANFSKASTVSNDENMLVIRGNTRIADIFLGEFMRLFNHFHSRNKRNSLSDEEFKSVIYLTPDDRWADRYYKPGTQEYNERRLFAGPGWDL